MRPWTKKAISAAVSVVILAAVYARLSRGELLEVLGRTDLGWLAVALSLLIPITVGSAWRFARVMPRGRSIGLAESTRLVLAASALNMVLPSKLGDLAKAFFLQERSEGGGALPVAAVFFEKASDLFALLVFCALGLSLLSTRSQMTTTALALVLGGLALLGMILFWRGFARRLFSSMGRLAPRRLQAPLESLAQAWSELLGELWGRGGQGPTVVLSSLALWVVHLVQLWLFARALGADVSLVAMAGLAPLAILAGLLPFTLAGIGTRDAALVFFFAPLMAPATAAALGLLTTLRYVVPALLGIPFLAPYAARMRASAAAATAGGGE